MVRWGRRWRAPGRVLEPASDDNLGEGGRGETSESGPDVGKAGAVVRSTPGGNCQRDGTSGDKSRGRLSKSPYMTRSCPVSCWSSLRIGRPSGFLTYQPFLDLYQIRLGRRGIRPVYRVRHGGCDLTGSRFCQIARENHRRRGQKASYLFLKTSCNFKHGEILITFRLGPGSRQNGPI